MIVGPMRPSPKMPTRAGASARAYSSWKTTCWVTDAPLPPYCLGHPMHVQPSPARWRSHASRTSKPSFSSRPGPPRPRASAKSPVRLASSQSRTSPRNASSSPENRRSIALGRLRRELVAQLVLEHLAGGVERQGVDHLDAAGNLEVRHALPAPGDELLGVDRVACLGNDKRGPHLAEARVGHTDDSHLGHVLVGEHGVLDLGR